MDVRIKGKKKARIRTLLAAMIALVAVSLAYFAYLQLNASNHALAEVSVGGRSYNVYLAITPEQQEKGLMNVTSIGDCNGSGNCLGMLFVNAGNPECFWMKDTIIPLKQYWISGNEISHVWTGVPNPLRWSAREGTTCLRPTQARTSRSARASPLSGSSAEAGVRASPA